MEDKKYFMDGPFGRFIRVLVSLVVTGLISKHQNDPTYMAAQPFINAGTKYLRDKFPGKFEWLPL